MTYTVKAGDTLSKIAARNGMTLRAIAPGESPDQGSEQDQASAMCSICPNAAGVQPVQPTTQNRFHAMPHASPVSARARLAKHLPRRSERCRRNMKQAAVDQARSRPAPAIPAVFPMAPIRWRRRWGRSRALSAQPGFPLGAEF